MEYVTLGRTGIQASVLGLGGGGHSRLGQNTGASSAQSAAIVRRAVELGVNFVDTAEVYGTEPLIGEALQGMNRQQIILSTKKSPARDGRLITADELRRGLDESLARLRTDYVDIYHLHGVRAEQYDHAVAELVPAMQALRDEGKIRFLGITEAFGPDPSHAMMTRAIDDPYWDVVMVGFNILNQSARKHILAEAMQQEIGVLCMFAVRNALSQPDALRETINTLVEQGVIDREAVDARDPLGFVREVASTLPEAAYRFCRAEPGVHVVLSGTGNIDHLEENVQAILKPPLPENVRQRLVEIFARVDSVSGQ